MRLDLHDIINLPGALPFTFETDVSDMEFPSVIRALSPLTASGTVTNSAGRITLSGSAHISLLCSCGRCGREFELDRSFPLSAVLSDELQDEENSDIYPLDGNFANLDEIIITAFVLGMDSRLLCSEDCMGLCSRCGADLNEGPCSCEKETDPRLAVLKQLLEDK
ncbi:MAG: DUF177 domain-containing protein [Clostridiales bacterium]|jgi:uncharacterized protein|nr:DUF177 domain-containing protein [Clostridiales bacterium]